MIRNKSKLSLKEELKPKFLLSCFVKLAPAPASPREGMTIQDRTKLT